MRNRWVALLVLAQAAVSVVAISAYVVVRATSPDETTDNAAAAPLPVTGTAPAQAPALQIAPPAPLGPAPTSFPMARANPARTGQYDSPELERPQGVIWKLDRFAGNSTHFVVAGDTIYFCRTEGTVFAVNAATGEVRWKYEGGGLHTDLVAADGNLYFFSNGVNGVVALDTATGALKWKHDFNKFIMRPGLLAFDGKVYFLNPHSLDALDAATGSTLWSFPFSTANVSTRIALADGRIFFGGSGEMYDPDLISSYYAVDAGTGQELWHIDLKEKYAADPVVSGGILFFATCTDEKYADDPHSSFGRAAIHAVNVTNGTEIWKFDIKDGDQKNLSRSMAAAGNLLAIYRNPRERGAANYIQVLDTRDGHELWRVEAGQLLSYPAIVGQSVLAVTLDDTSNKAKLHAFEAANGYQKWQWDIDGNHVAGEIIISKGIIYLNAVGLEALH